VFIYRTRYGNGGEMSGVGEMWLKKIGKENTVRIDYHDSDSGLRKMLITSTKIRIIDENKKESVLTTNVSRTPIAIILGTVGDVLKEKYSIKNFKEYVSLELEKKINGIDFKIVLLFSKFGNGNIKAMIGWQVIESYKSETSVKFSENSLVLNDESKVSSKIFEEFNEKNEQKPRARVALS
jgi:hypothetical protein